MSNTNNALCVDIYKEEIEKTIKTLKRFREVLLKSSFRFTNEMFQYADDDFYFYRFAVSREEQGRITLLDNIIYRVLERYNIDFKVPDSGKDAPFDFLIQSGEKHFGYTFEDFYADEDVNELLLEYELEKAFIIRTVKNKKNTRIEEDNVRYLEQGINLADITIREFFEEYFSSEEYLAFENAINDYIEQSKKIMGYQSIKVLSAMNLSAQRIFEEKILSDWDYENSKYQIINTDNPKIQKVTYVGEYDLSGFCSAIRERYIKSEMFKAMIGTENYAESFITSEWLYYSLKGKENFDYTAIVSGYLKSIEQLLHKLVMLNIDNGCVISLKGDKATKQKAINNSVSVYEVRWDNKSQSIVRTQLEQTKVKGSQHPYIDFTDCNKEYMDSSIGTFEFFLRNNPEIFVDPKLSKVISDMVSCFRTECRNGYFHTHNLHDTSVVEMTRENAILLYFVLLGSIKNVIDKKEQLGVESEDRFDSICKEIREIRHYKANFIFVYEDGSEKKMIYDFINNTPEYTENGIEHYESLIFYEVEDFSMETYEELDTPIREGWKFLLTKDNLPKRIYCYDINKKIHEVNPELLR